MPPPPARRLVALQIPDQAAAARAVLGAWDAGEAVVVLDPRLPVTQTQRLLAQVRPHVLRTADGDSDLPDPLPLDERVAAVVATSGSTGSPKAVELSTAALDAAAGLTNDHLGARAGDVWVCCLPLSHVAGLMVLRRARSLGTAPVAVGPDAAGVSAAEGSFVSMVPTQVQRALDEGLDLSSFRSILVGGAGTSAALVERANAAGINLVRSYGMTETCGGVVYDGIPLQGVDVDIDPEGRITIASPTLMERYRGLPEETESVLRAGRFVTSDLGRIEKGKLAVLGRVDDVIVTGGEKVLPKVVEDALAAHPEVREAVVFGVPDEEWGAKVVALVEADPQRLELEGVRRWLRERVARHEVPKEIEAVESLPRTPLGKLDVRAIRGTYLRRTR